MKTFNVTIRDFYQSHYDREYHIEANNEDEARTLAKTATLTTRKSMRLSISGLATTPRIHG